MATAEFAAAEIGGSQCCNLGDHNQRCRIVIIGGGSAAFAAAAAAAPFAASVKIVNEGLPMGGTCVNVGCVPSKFLIQAAHISSPHNSSPPYHGFSNVSERVSDFAALTAQNRQLVEDLREKKYANVIAGLNNVEYVQGLGRILRKGDYFSIAVDCGSTEETPSRELLADRVILATGVRTSLPKQLLPDLEKVPYLTNETAYFEPILPESLIVLGGGYVAVEAAQMFARLGSRVTLLQRSSHILSDTDEDIGLALAGYLREEGIDVVVGLEILSATLDDGKVMVTARLTNGKPWTFKASKIFVATGRRAKTENVSEVPLRLSDSPHGGFVVSDTLQTSISGVYAAGDCVAGSPQYVYTAAAEGKLAALNALASFNGQKESPIDYSVVPWVVFSSPAVAGVGLDVHEARAKGIDAETSIVPLSLLPRAIVQQETRGFVTLIRNKQDDTIIGARILAEEGGELAMEASLCVQHKIKAQELAGMFHPYLTWNEAWKLAALGFSKDVNQLSCCA
ncbi:mercuric reductase MerA, partial [Paecilomyces variotii]